MPRATRAKPRALRCTYKEGNRRCPYDGDGEPSLCKAHRIALAEVMRPKAPARVLLETLGDWLQGKPINREATIGAAEDFLNQWAGTLGSEYRPDMFDGASEDHVHQRAQSGQGRPWYWNIAHAAAQGQAGHAGQARQSPPGPDQDLIRARVAARQVMGFAPRERLDAEMIKRRHRELVRKNHPDRHPGRPEFHRKMAAINAANDVLVAELG